MFRVIRYFFCFLLLTISCLCKAQIDLPNQIDVYSVRNVTYSISQILPENWPCKEIRKSATSFYFDDKEFIILDEENELFSSSFTVEDKKTKEKFDLVYRLNTNNTVVFYFGGYTFVCSKPEEKWRGDDKSSE